MKKKDKGNIPCPLCYVFNYYAIAKDAAALELRSAIPV